MNDSSNTRRTLHSETLRLHIAASMRGLKLLVYYARLCFLRSFFEVEQQEGDGRALGRHRLKFHSIFTHQSV